MLLVGVGNRMRGDDGVGPEVVDRVAALHLPELAGLEVATDHEPVGLLHRLLGPAPPDRVVVVDATAPLGHPGRVRVLRGAAGAWALPSSPVGSHALGLADVIELARVLGVLPPYLTVVGVAASRVDLGTDLSEPVRDSLEEAVAVVVGVATAAADRR